VRELGAGDHFGEEALLQNHHHDATVTAKTDVRCFVLERRDFAAVTARLPGASQAPPRRRPGVGPRRLRHPCTTYLRVQAHRPSPHRRLVLRLRCKTSGVLVTCPLVLIVCAARWWRSTRRRLRARWVDN
jgi:CRP-like cAMP-binding protein